MAQLKKLTDINLDKNKTAIVCGKGPSISRLSEFLYNKSLKDFYFFSINTAYRLMPKADYISLADLNKLDEMDYDPMVYEDTDNYIIPLVFRHNILPDHPSGRVVESDKTYNYLLEKLKNYNSNIFTYKLFTQDRKVITDTNKQDDFLIEYCRSNIQCCIIWAIKAGLKHFEIFVTSRSREYAKNFIDRKEDNGIPNQWFASNYDLTVNILEKNNCTYNIY